MPILGVQENIAPAYVLEAGKTVLNTGITDLITDVSYESADGMADVMKIRCSNPDFRVSDARVFQPGNEAALWMGYGNNLSFVGRVVIDKVQANFPGGHAMPEITVTGFTRDVQMKDNAPPEVKKKKGEKKKGRGGRSFPDSSYADAVESRLSDYGFKTDVEPTKSSRPRDLFQKAGMNDYEFVQGLANITGFVFWVEGDEDGNWNAYFLDPEGQKINQLQDKKYTFEYNTELATLQAFDAEQVFTGASTKIVYEVHDPKTGKTEKIEIEAEDTKFDSQIRQEPYELISGDPVDAARIKLFIGDFSIEVASGKQFKDPADFQAWAAQWFRRNRENFIMARGNIIGTETLRARQTHAIGGVGEVFSGDYYFSRVRHNMSSSGGFITDFNCRKVIG
jgi:phage protein D